MNQLTWKQADEIAAANGPCVLGFATVSSLMVKYGVKENVARQILSDASAVAVRAYRAALTDVGANDRLGPSGSRRAGSSGRRGRVARAGSQRRAGQGETLMPAKIPKFKFRVVFSPTGGCVIVEAKDAKSAKRKAPKEWKKYKGEIYAEKIDETSVCYRWRYGHIIRPESYDRLRLRDKTWFMVFDDGLENEASAGFAAALFEALAGDNLMVVQDANFGVETKA